MVANIVVLSIIAILAVIAIRKIIMDRKNGVPSCGYACGGNCSSCATANVNRPTASTKTEAFDTSKVSEEELQSIRDRIHAREKASK